MRWLRPSLLIAVSAALTVGALALVIGSFWEGTAARAVPLPLREGDQEVVWLYAATNTSWERFVSAVRRVQTDSPDLGLEVDESNAFPRQTTAVPELALAARGSKSWLRFRWYKLTSELKTQDWVKALVEKRRPPLAVIGGSSSDLAIELAQVLQRQAQEHGDGVPLLLLTTATSDEARTLDDRLVPLSSLYGGRTFRFCFTNRQMADAVTDFLWSQDDLRPDADPVYVAYWEDDPYSGNLTGRFMESLGLRAVRAAAQDWAWFAGFSVAGGVPLDLAAVQRGQVRLSPVAVTERIPYSVGTFLRPNRWEADAAQALTERLAQHPHQRRPLLVLPATSQPARRFLHGLVRNAPVDAQRFVVATGDGIAFNTIYRDRNVAWPIQDLPFPLVFFCHRNPVDARAGFSPETESRAERPDEGSPTTGTEDLLLFADIVQALVHAAYKEGSLLGGPEELAKRLSTLHRQDHGQILLDLRGIPLFDADGNRRSGTGEHLVCLRPVVEAKRLLPQSTITVWSRQGAWRLARPPLRVEYDESTGEGSQ